MPEPLSVQVKVTVTSLLFQLRVLAAGAWVWLMPGAVLSILTVDVLLRLDVAGDVHAPHLERVHALGVDRDAGAVGDRLLSSW